MRRPPEEPQKPLPDVEKWIDTWKHKLMGMVLDGMCSSPEARARRAMNLPGLIETVLRQAYMDLLSTKQEPTNGTTNGTKTNGR